MRKIGSQKIERAIRLVFGCAALILLFVQSLGLFVLPKPDALRWYGDESWLMNESVAHISTGVNHYPQAHGSTLEHTTGFVLGNVWLASAIYGIPALLAP